MPRKSSASGDILHVYYVPGERPPPPAELTPEQGRVWTEIVDHLAASQFSPEMFPLLVSLCRNTVYARQFAQWLDENPIGSTKGLSTKHRFALNAFLALQKQISSLSVKLRLTPQSRYLPRYGTESKAVREADAAHRSGRRPWDIYVDDDADEADNDAAN